jgi:hypothetical protein
VDNKEIGRAAGDHRGQQLVIVDAGRHGLDAHRDIRVFRHKRLNHLLHGDAVGACHEVPVGQLRIAIAKFSHDGRRGRLWLIGGSLLGRRFCSRRLGLSRRRTGRKNQGGKNKQGQQPEFLRHRVFSFCGWGKQKRFNNRTRSDRGVMRSLPESLLPKYDQGATKGRVDKHEFLQRKLECPYYRINQLVVNRGYFVAGCGSDAG